MLFTPDLRPPTTAALLMSLTPRRATLAERAAEAMISRCNLSRTRRGDKNRFSKFSKIRGGDRTILKLKRNTSRDFNYFWCITERCAAYAITIGSRTAR